MKLIGAYAVVALCCLILMLAYDVSAQRGPGEFFGGQFSQSLRGPLGSATTPTYSFAGSGSGIQNSGLFLRQAGLLGVAVTGTEEVEFTSTNVRLASDQVLGWTASGSAGAAQDTTIARSAASAITLGSDDNLLIPVQAAASGTRYVCITTTGLLQSSAAACSGT